MFVFVIMLLFIIIVLFFEIKFLFLKFSYLFKENNKKFVSKLLYWKIMNVM